MRVLLLGATGFIGSAIIPELFEHGHSIIALARSDAAENQLVDKGVGVVRGDLREPEKWSNYIHEVDAVIHVAATFTDDMGDVDRQAIEALVAQGNRSQKTTRFIYTGGVWLYGQTGDHIATEDTPLNPISSFSWMVENSRYALNAPCFNTSIVHPGIVYVRDGGAFSRLIPIEGRIEVWGSVEKRWPLVHRDDLAAAYRIVLEKGKPGESYNVCSEKGVRLSDITNVISERFDLTTKPLVRSIEELISEHGEWAEGPTLDQQMSNQKMLELGWSPEHLDAVAELL
ncbi:MAG: NAD-dependent epimerase/dehydratase family protein [Leptolyngbyaceae cyanobacterium]